MKKIGIITFHASHNYGSMLQAYALKRTVEALGYICEIINFRTKRQKDIYKPFCLSAHWLQILKTIKYPKLALDDLKKHRLFEKFLRNYLTTSHKEFSNSQQLADAHLDYDAYISGSDQIWNTCCFDYDAAYFLDFTSNATKIAYAPSMGPNPETQVKASDEPAIKAYLSAYNFISVREEGTADRVERIAGKRPEVCLDPTLLLNKEKWYAMTDCASYIQGDYILLYTPFYDELSYDKTLELAERLNLKVVVTLPTAYFRYRNNQRMVFHTAVGPKEFLTLIRFAKLVACKSFHAVVFSIMFSRPFYAINGLKDNRVSNLLRLTGLERFAEYPQKSILDIPEEVFSKKFDALSPAKEKSIKFLQEALS